VLNSGEGWEIPCQPRLNSSINFVIGFVTSRDQRIQNKADSVFERTGRGRTASKLAQFARLMRWKTRQNKNIEHRF